MGGVGLKGLIKKLFCFSTTKYIFIYIQWMKKIIELIKEKWGEYVIEILVITLGIFGAFILNNWNESRKQNERFKIFTEQLYNTVDKDIEYYNNQELFYGQQNEFIDNILNNQINYSKEELLVFLFSLDGYHSNYQSESKLLLNFMDLNEENEKQNKIVREVISYLLSNEYNDVEKFHKKSDLPVTNFLMSKGYQKQDFGIFTINYFKNSQRSFYDPAIFDSNDLNKIYPILKSQNFIKLLHNVKFKKHISRTVILNTINSCKSLQKLLLNYNPKIKLLYGEIGIIGDALSSGFEKSVPMERDNSKIGFWKIKLNLKKGKIKFINRNDWLQNWGGNSFPNGKSMFDGTDILVDEGYYNIILDLENKIYSFEKLDSIK